MQYSWYGHRRILRRIKIKFRGNWACGGEPEGMRLTSGSYGGMKSSSEVTGHVVAKRSVLATSVRRRYIVMYASLAWYDPTETYGGMKSKIRLGGHMGGHDVNN